MANSVREVMTSSPECVREDETLADAARRLAELDVGALPICDEGGSLKGMLTDRDIVVKAIAQGKDPGGTTAGEFAQGDPATVSPDDPVDEALRQMTEHKVRRLPVVEDGRVAGIVSQADLATKIDEEKVGDLVEAISAAP